MPAKVVSCHLAWQEEKIAVRLLIRTRPDLKLTAIAEQVGFKEYSLFIRDFKFFFGVPPVTCRQLDRKPAS